MTAPERQMREDVERRSIAPLTGEVAELKGEIRQAAQMARSGRNAAADRTAAA